MYPTSASHSTISETITDDYWQPCTLLREVSQVIKTHTNKQSFWNTIQLQTVTGLNVDSLHTGCVLNSSLPYTPYTVFSVSMEHLNELLYLQKSCKQMCSMQLFDVLFDQTDRLVGNCTILSPEWDANKGSWQKPNSIDRNYVDCTLSSFAFSQLRLIKKGNKVCLL